MKIDKWNAVSGGKTDHGFERWIIRDVPEKDVPRVVNSAKKHPRYDHHTTREQGDNLYIVFVYLRKK